MRAAYNFPSGHRVVRREGGTINDYYLFCPEVGGRTEVCHIPAICMGMLNGKTICPACLKLIRGGDSSS